MYYLLYNHHRIIISLEGSPFTLRELMQEEKINELSIIHFVARYSIESFHGSGIYVP